MTKIKGIDVSHYQGNIDFSKLPKEIEFAILKCTEGLTVKDAQFNEYKKNARKHGMGLGFYHFARGLDAKKEADFFLESAGDIAEGEILALDFEIHITDPVKWCQTFIDRIIEKVGFNPLFYSYSSTIGGYDWGKLYNCGLWIADPSATPRIGKWKFWALWQYGQGKAGSMSGIETSIDLDYFNGSLDTFKKYGRPVIKADAPGVAPQPQVLPADPIIVDTNAQTISDLKNELGNKETTIAELNKTTETLSMTLDEQKIYSDQIFTDREALREENKRLRNMVDAFESEVKTFWQKFKDLFR